MEDTKLDKYLEELVKNLPVISFGIAVVILQLLNVLKLGIGLKSWGYINITDWGNIFILATIGVTAWMLMMCAMEVKFPTKIAYLRAQSKTNLVIINFILMWGLVFIGTFLMFLIEWGDDSARIVGVAIHVYSLVCIQLITLAGFLMFLKVMSYGKAKR